MVDIIPAVKDQVMILVKYLDEIKVKFEEEDNKSVILRIDSLKIKYEKKQDLPDKNLE